jgi:SH3-like domain-containing protein
MPAVLPHLSPSSTRRLQRLISAVVIALGLSVPAVAQQSSVPAKTEKPKAADKPASKPAPKPAAKAEAAKDAKESAASPAESTIDPGPNENSTATPNEPSLPVPRFVSFRTDPVNLRTGPGVRYPVEWIYMRRRLPVEIIAEFETWRQIRDVDGAEGWVHQSMLSGRRTGMIKGQAQALRKTNADQSDTLAMLEPGVVIDVQRCPGESPFCRVEVNGMQGWLKRDQFWGVYPQEKIE